MASTNKQAIAFSALLSPEVVVDRLRLLSGSSNSLRVVPDILQSTSPEGQDSLDWSSDLAIDASATIRAAFARF